MICEFISLAYVEEIYQTFITASSNKTLQNARKKLVAMTPDSMNTMLEKEPRDAAIRKQKARKSLVVEDVPPTTPSMIIYMQYVQCYNTLLNIQVKWGNNKSCYILYVFQLQPSLLEKELQKLRKNLMKGHKNIKDCPKNQK